MYIIIYIYIYVYCSRGSAASAPTCCSTSFERARSLPRRPYVLPHVALTNETKPITLYNQHTLIDTNNDCHMLYNLYIYIYIHIHMYVV